jgi:tetratricopeptide repeat protein 21B
VFFDNVIEMLENDNKKSLEALLGKAKVYERQKKYENGIQILSEACVCFPKFKPALIEKGKLHIQNNEWDQAIDAITTVTATDKTSVEALRVYVFYLMARENDHEMTEEKLNELIELLKRIEGKNADLFYNISRLYARYCGRKEFILTRTLQILDIAIMLSPDNCMYMTEAAHQKALQGDYQAAYQTF